MTALAVSAGIELIQFLTYRGMLDVDDLISVWSIIPQT
jgi:glycopeptide antibiotics resistance protein